jgi:nucleoside-diphosphate-sugar epimerase
MRAFITGGTGFIGRQLIQHLLDNGYEVTALVRTFERARALPRAVRTIPGDVLKRETLRAGMRDADVVFHLAAVYALGKNPKEVARMERINVEGTRQVLELAAELGVPKIVHTSSVAVLGNTRGQIVDESHRAEGAIFESEYERTKHAAHYTVAVPLQQRGAPLSIVCPGMAYGPGDASSPWGKLLRRYAHRRLPLMIGPHNALTWAHVGDVALGHRLAAEAGRPGETYLLAGPVHTYQEFFQVGERVTGLPAPRLWLPAKSADVVAKALQKISPATAELFRNVAGLSYLARSDKAQTELGWTPRALEDGILETIEWHLSLD